MKPFLILQLRPETEASDDEYQAFLTGGRLSASQTHRVRLDQEYLPTDLQLEDYSGVIVGGGPGCVSDAPDKKSTVEARIESAVLGLMPEITKRDFPFMGCCYGIGILAHHLGAPVNKERYGEPVSAVVCQIVDGQGGDAMLKGVAPEFQAFVGHKEAVQELPVDCAHLVASPRCPYQMIRFGHNVYATQFHPEADAAGFETRINIYKDRGYFAPEDAERVIMECRAADVDMPALILKNFVERYRR